MFEDDLGWEYFGGDPDHSPRMAEHMDWHMDPQNQNRTGNYGERFLTFHQQYIDKFDVFRKSKGLLPVSGWDPTTQIPAALSHDHVLHSARHTDNPYAVAPACKTPSWATIAGGIDLDPVYGYTKLIQFRSLDELGGSIDSGWHGVVHNTIGGDMATFDSPIDPIFWRWHKWIDNVRVSWEALQRRLVSTTTTAIIQILFGGINDAPGIGLTPGGHVVPIPSGPGDPFHLAAGGNLLDSLTALSSRSNDTFRDSIIEELSSRLSSRDRNNVLQHLGQTLMAASQKE